MGAEFNLNQITLQPDLKWIFVDDDAIGSEYDLSEQVQARLAAYYPINDRLDLGVSYSYTFGTDFSYIDGTDSYSVEPYAQLFSIGLEYKF